MNARNDVKTTSHQSLTARLDRLVARWLERCAANAEAGQWLFTRDRKPVTEFGMDVSLAGPAPRWDQS